MTYLTRSWEYISESVKEGRAVELNELIMQFSEQRLVYSFTFGRFDAWIVGEATSVSCSESYLLVI